MTYINKQITLKDTGHINEHWEVDFTTVSLKDLLTEGTVYVHMRGTKSLVDKNNGCVSSDTKPVRVLATDLELSGSIGYSDIPKLYEVLTTKTCTTIVDEEEVEVPAFPDFFGGVITQ